MQNMQIKNLGAKKSNYETGFVEDSFVEVYNF